MIRDQLRSKKVRLALGLVLAACLVISGVAAAIANSYALSPNVLSNGGAIGSAGGGYSLSGTVGQETVYQSMTGGDFTLTGGFWAGQPSTLVYLPLLQK